jgi:hypothetical protein
MLTLQISSRQNSKFRWFHVLLSWVRNKFSLATNFAAILYVYQDSPIAKSKQTSETHSPPNYSRISLTKRVCLHKRKQAHTLQNISPPNLFWHDCTKVCKIRRHRGVDVASPCGFQVEVLNQSACKRRVGKICHTDTSCRSHSSQGPYKLNRVKRTKYVAALCT